jgi:hypothetical protein
MLDIDVFGSCMVNGFFANAIDPWLLLYITIELRGES